MVVFQFVEKGNSFLDGFATSKSIVAVWNVEANPQLFQPQKF